MVRSTNIGLSDKKIFNPPPLIELLKGAGVALEEKEASKLEAMSDRSGNIDRMDFMVYAKKSSIFKILTDAERQQTQDKAEIAFKVCSLTEL